METITVSNLGYDALDKEALSQIREAFKTAGMDVEAELIGTDMHAIVKGMNKDDNSGGALNCLTWTIES